jgi:enoyl-CoA hydratase
MAERVTYQAADGVGTITLDDGKVNALSPVMLSDIDAAFDRAEKDDVVVVLAGRAGVFSAGFDLKTIRAGGQEAADMLRGGFELAYRILSFPRPVVVACTGHAIAMGAFLVASGDYRIGEGGADFTISANEVAIGMALPPAAIEICRVKLTRTGIQRALTLAERFTPDSAIAVGFLDARASGSAVTAAQEHARALTQLHRGAHIETKLRLRDESLKALRAAIDATGPVEIQP